MQFVQDHLTEDPAHLLLSHKSLPGMDLKAAAQQIAMRQKAAKKLPFWASHPSLIFPPSLSMEQCSSELTAKYKARLVAGKTFIDLTGGFAVDTFYIGQHFTDVTYIERQEELVELAQHNLAKLFGDQDIKLKVVHQESVHYIQETQEKYDVLYIDPARRGTGNQKMYRLEDLEPDITQNWDLFHQKAKVLLIKASPMLDIHAALIALPEVNEVHVVGVKNEVKELLFLSTDSKGPVKIIATELSGNSEQQFSFTLDEELNAVVKYSLPQKYLVLPYSCILKTGAFKSFAVRFGLSKLHPHTHLYTTNELPDPVNGRVFEVLEELKLDKKILKARFPDWKVNVLTRNFPIKPDLIKKRYKLKDGGNEYLIACTLMDGQTSVLRCRLSQESK
ncbi:class I SAM-dependent methyltransferase [Cyclobacterium qasimii]|nr:class I SAM-dependent methyltransferase [Cyclobacterium qasimii]EPR68982.1 SAM-dependent methyltransferase [Cyclobacterium qasimii M12-11B]